MFNCYGITRKCVKYDEILLHVHEINFLVFCRFILPQKKVEMKRKTRVFGMKALNPCCES